MIATSLAAALAVLAPNPQDALPTQPVPYASASSSVPGYSATYQGRVLNDQDTALFRQGLAAARARDVFGAQSAMSQIRISRERTAAWQTVNQESRRRRLLTTYFPQ